MNADDTRYAEYLKSDRWREIAKKRLEIDNYECQMCGCKGTSINPLEVHHLSYAYIYHEDERVYQDLVTLCHCCHKQIHKAMERRTNEQGRRGWRDSSKIPQIHTFNIHGAIELIEEPAKV